MTATSAPAAPPLRPLGRAALVLPALLAAALLADAPDLGHPAISGSDEVVHQLATLGIRETGTPMVYRAPLVEAPLHAWWNAHVFLHKPPLPFALGALLMRLVGETPLALRLVALASAFAAAAGLFLFGRRIVEPTLAALLALAFLALPFGWVLVQGYEFGDVTDCGLLGFLALSMWLLAVAVGRDSTRLSAAAGAVCGCAYLSKSALALMPLGAAGSLFVLGLLGLAPRLRFSLVAAFALAAVAVALPWNLYSAIEWPRLYRWEAGHTAGFLYDTSRYWSRPIDGVFNEVNQTELGPWPPAIFPLAGLWLLWAAMKRRTAELWLLCLWLWGEWIPLSLAVVKVPAHAWGAAPAALLAVGLVLRDALDRPWLAGAAVGALTTGVALKAAPWLSIVRRAVPAFLPQTASQPGLAEGLAAALALGALAAAGGWLLRRNRWAARLPGWAALTAAGWVGLVAAPAALQLRRLSLRNAAVESDGDDLGPILDAALPASAVLLSTVEDTPYRMGSHALMFYSRRTTYPATPNLLAAARRSGLHPYLVSNLAQPYERVEAPASSWLQAYDLDAPRAEPATMPTAVTPVNRILGVLDVLGVAVARGDADRDRYVFYVRSAAPLGIRRIDVAFWLDDGSVEHTTLVDRPELEGLPAALDPRASQAPAAGLAAWVTDPTASAWIAEAVPGPPRARLRRLQVLGTDLPLP
ncbi:MAG TPA: glycosyltransferase family 39 protein [Myxococcales bacterium]|nr:glycosyltransferase family 39 protein [Myxococcales bacterium]